MIQLAILQVVLDWWAVLLIAIGCLIIGGLVVFLIYRLLPSLRKKSAKKAVDQMMREGKIKAEQRRKEAELDTKQWIFQAKQNAQNEIQKMKGEAIAEEQRLKIREQTLHEKERALLAKENSLEQKNEVLDRKIEANEKKSAELEEKIDSIIAELEKVSGLSVKEAHDEIMARVESKMSVEIATYIKNAEDEARDTAEAKAIDLLSLACQRYAQDVTTERNVSVVPLPSDELKGRIIGREGRNIRSLEAALGVDLVIDDTPEVITVSCFDPIRREVAKRTLEYLIKDGRIQPGRIEEVAAKCKREVAESAQKAGEAAAFKLGLPKINREMLQYVGRLKYRTSYGQNALDHSIEVAYLSGMMAAELGLDQNLAKRAGLLHDIGKSVDFELEGGHVALGAELAKKYGEPDVVINSIESHHGDVPAKYVISHLVAAADTLSAARPGARSETVETYVKRIEALENLAKKYDGVSQAYAMQSGREIRVMVIPEKVSDAEAIRMSVQIKDEIEKTLTYPGQIKVSVIREYRAVETAK